MQTLLYSCIVFVFFHTTFFLVQIKYLGICSESENRRIAIKNNWVTFLCLELPMYPCRKFEKHFTGHTSSWCRTQKLSRIAECPSLKNTGEIDQMVQLYRSRTNVNRTEKGNTLKHKLWNSAIQIKTVWRDFGSQRGLALNILYVIYL